MSGQPQLQGFVDDRALSDGTSMLHRIGTIVGSAALAAVVASLPVAFRTQAEGSVGLVLERWLVLAGMTTPLAVVAVTVIERARVGLRMLVGERRTPLMLGLLWWCVIELALLAVFGAVLRKTTHHHALAGVTFAMFAVVSGVAVALFAVRTTALLVRSGPGGETMGLRIAAACACLAVFIVGLRTSGAEGLHTTAAIADGFIFVVMTVLATSRFARRFARLAIVVGPLAVILIVVGLVTLRLDGSMQKELEGTAPMFALVSGIFGD